MVTSKLLDPKHFMTKEESKVRIQIGLTHIFSVFAIMIKCECYATGRNSFISCRNLVFAVIFGMLTI